MNLKKFIQSYIIPSIGLILAIDSKVSSNQNMKKIEAFHKKTEADLIENRGEVQELKSQLSSTQEALVEILKTQAVDSSSKPTLDSLSLKILHGKELIIKIEEKNRELDIINSAIIDANNTGTVSSELLAQHKSVNDNLHILNEEYKNMHKEIYDIVESATKNSDISSIFSSIIENYRDFLANLASDQLVAIINLIGFYMVFAAIITITFVILGDFIIEKLNLEARLPNLAKYIKLQKSLRKGYLYFNIAMLYIIVIAFIIGNLCMIAQIF